MAKVVDWPAIEIDYRAGIKPLRHIGADHGGVSHVAIQKRAKAEGWTRDLSARIKAKTEELVTRAAVTKIVTKEKLVTEQQTVDANAALQSQVILGHRNDIHTLRNTITCMAAELGCVGHTDLQDALGLVLVEKMQDLSNQQAKTALYKAFSSALALSGRAGAGRNLASALGVLIEKERQAFGIDKEGTERKSLGEWLESLA